MSYLFVITGSKKYFYSVNSAKIYHVAKSFVEFLFFLKVVKACLSEQIKVHFLQFSALDLVDKFLMKLN